MQITLKVVTVNSDVRQVWADVYGLPVPGCDGQTAAQIFSEAGCETPASPSCAACLGGPQDTYARMNEAVTCVSTTNRLAPCSPPPFHVPRSPPLGGTRMRLNELGGMPRACDVLVTKLFNVAVVCYRPPTPPLSVLPPPLPPRAHPPLGEYVCTFERAWGHAMGL